MRRKMQILDQRFSQNWFSQKFGMKLSHAVRLSALGVIAVGGIVACDHALGQDGFKPPRPMTRRIGGPIEERTPVVDTEAKKRADKFAEYMTGASLKGRFTITGRGDKMPEETYTISKCEKLPEGNLYRFTARIQYGDTDTELPMDIPVEWAGDTPIISLTKMWLPGLGTFSARVLIYQDTYAGTWIHDDVGGQMFGAIVKDAKPAEEDSSESKANGKPETKPKPKSNGK